MILKFMWKHETQKANAILNKKNKFAGITVAGYNQNILEPAQK